MLVADATLGSLRAQIVDADQSSVAPTHIRGNDVEVVFHDATIGILSMGVFAFVPEGNGFSAKVWQLPVAVFGEPAVGRVYAVKATSDQTMPDTAVMSFEETQMGMGDWTATGGSIVVKSVVGRTVGFSFESVTLEAAGLGATGTFSIVGDLTVNDIDATCNCLD